MAKFLDFVFNRTMGEIRVYNDIENTHNSNIQTGVKQSIENMVEKVDSIASADLCDVLNKILLNKVFSQDTKNTLIDFCQDKTVHALLELSFEQVLWSVFETIERDFQKETQDEIYRILEDEILESVGKCFTGRLCRLVNCLNGFSPLVAIEMSDIDQISNIIIMTRKNISSQYNVDRHMQLVNMELSERGFSPFRYRRLATIYQEYLLLISNTNQ